MKRKLSIVLALLLVISGFNVEAFKVKADGVENINNFDLGGNVVANYDSSSNTLKITGYGQMDKDKWVQMAKLIDPQCYENNDYGFYYAWNGTGNFNISIKGDGTSDKKKIKFPADSSYLFQTFDEKITLDCPSIDTSNVTTMAVMFGGAEKFNQDLTFDTSNVTNMNSMFIKASNFNGKLNFSDTSNVTTMKLMFYRAKKFNQEVNFDTRNVEKFDLMFYDTASFEQKIEFTSQKSNVIVSEMFLDSKVKNVKLNLGENAKGRTTTFNNRNTLETLEFTPIKNLKIRRNAFKENYRIMASSDGVNWTTVEDEHDKGTGFNCKDNLHYKMEILSSLSSSPSEVKFTVNYNYDNGAPEIDKEVLLQSGDFIDLSAPEISHEGKKFAFWQAQLGTAVRMKGNFRLKYNNGAWHAYDDDGKGGALGYDSLTLKAIWNAADDETLVVNFDTKGGRPNIGEKRYRLMEKLNSKDIPEPSKEGYSFQGWKVKGTEKILTLEEFYFHSSEGKVLGDKKNRTKVQSPVTIEAVWKEKEQEDETSNEEVDTESKPRYVTVQFDAKGGDPNPPTQSVKVGEKVVRPKKDPKKDGYTFIDWFDAEGKYDFNQAVKTKMILYAKYKKEGVSHQRSRRQDIDVADKDYDKAIMKYKDAFYKGYPDGRFKPEGNITRAEMAAVFSRILGLDKKTPSGGKSFSDINNHWAKNDILMLAEYGMINGYPDGEFRPGGNITRAELCAMIKKYWDIKGFEPSLRDANISDIDKHWAKKMILVLYNHGFVDVVKGEFKPNELLKRAEVAQILNRITDRRLINVPQLYNDVPKSHWAYKEINTASSQGR